MSRPATKVAPRAAFQLHIVVGTVRGEVVHSESADGASLVGFDLVVVDDDGRTLVPVTCRDLDAPALGDGDEVAVRGRVAKRFHRAGGRTVARTALEAAEVLVHPRPAALARLVARAERAATP